MRRGIKKQTHTSKKAPRPQHPFLPLGSPDISWHARPEHERLQDSARAVSNERCHPSVSLPSHTPGGNIPCIKPHLGKEQSSHHCHAHYQKAPLVSDFREMGRRARLITEHDSKGFHGPEKNKSQ